MVPVSEALASCKFYNQLRLLDRPACCLSIGGRTFGCIGRIYECVERGRQVFSDVHLYHRRGPS
jgi:hypothetical protein